MAAVDPFGPWTWRRRLLWLVLAAAAVYWLGPFQFRAMLVSPQAPFVDFFLDWSAARNHIDGFSIYMNPQFSAERYFRMPPGAAPYRVLGHPPNCILYVYPFGYLTYPAAFFLWNVSSVLAFLFSLWLIARGLKMKLTFWVLFPLITCIMISMQFMSHLLQGQWSALLLLLLVLTWRCLRSGYPFAAGIPLGIAVSIKLFPGLLALTFLRRRYLGGVLSLGVTLALLVWAAAHKFGYETFEIYSQYLAPEATEFCYANMNASVVGFWYRLFIKPLHGPVTSNIPLANWPYVAYLGTFVSVIIILAVCFITLMRLWQAAGRESDDIFFALVMTAMLLVSPITWDHYLILLSLPLAIVWCELTRRGMRCWGLAMIFLGLMFPTSLVDWFWYAQVRSRNAIEPIPWVLRPFESVFIFSVPTYAMVGLFAYCVWLVLTHAASTPAVGVNPSEGAPGGMPPRMPAPSGRKSAR